MKHRLPALYLSSLLLLSGCASQPMDTMVAGPERELLLQQQALFSGSDEPPEPLPEADLLALDSHIIELLRQEVGRGSHIEFKIRRILKLIFKHDEIRLRYSLIETHSARDTFYTRQANCLSFTNLFIAMAREVGLKASYQEVEVPANWEASGEFTLYNRHINTLIDSPRGQDISVDFNITTFRPNFPTRVISDEEAVALYHNNMAVHHLLKGDMGRAYQHQVAALAINDQRGIYWTNLGVLFRQLDRDDYAETAFLAAAALDYEEYLAMGHLARLYREQGKWQQAQYYDERVEAFRLRNPYFLLRQAEQDYARGDYEAAIGKLKRAIARREDEERFHRLLGLSYLMNGQREKASESFRLARKYAVNDAARDVYGRKILLLRDAQ